MELVVASQKVFAATGGHDFDRSRPVVVLVHGAGFDRTSWVLQTRYLAHHGFSVLAVDLPGHGLSEGRPLSSIAELGDWLAALVDAVGVDQAILVGHSMGALASLACAARYPDKVAKLALLGVAEAMPVHPDLLAAAEAGEHRAFELISGWSFGAAGHRGGHESPGSWMVGTGIRTLERSRPGVLHADLVACSTFRDGVVLAGDVRCPTLFLLGEEDRMTPVRAAQGLIDEMTDASIVVLPGAGHTMMTEQPRNTIAALERFLSS